MSSFLDRKQGIYDLTKTYAVKNITDKPFTFRWNSNPMTIQPGKELNMPEHFMIVAVTKMVDEIMQEETRIEEVSMRKELRDPYWRSPKGISMGVPAARKVYEDKIVREVQLDDSDPQTQIRKVQLKEEIMGNILDGQKQPAPIEAALGGIASTNGSAFPKEFADIGVK